MTYTVVLSGLLLNSMLVGNMAALRTKLLGEIRAFGEGAIRVAVGVVLWQWSVGCSSCMRGKTYGIAGVGAVGSVASFGCDLAQLVLGKVGEVGGIGIGHFDGLEMKIEWL